jgi:uncharacterized membrane protein required for colicin V production
MPQRGEVETKSSPVPLEVGLEVAGAAVLGGADTGDRLVGACVGFAVGLLVVEEVEDVVVVTDVTGALVTGLAVGDRLVGAFVGLLVAEDLVVAVVVAVVVVVVDFVTVAEQLAVLLTSPITVEPQAPPTSCCATQKNAPPLHPNTPWL